MSSGAVMPRIFVLGNFVQACCWMVPRLPLAGETLLATGLHVEAGGKGLNVAICLQRLGASVSTLIGCGNDSAGKQLLALLKREGLDTAHVHQLTGASGWGSGWIGANGQNAIAVYPGANQLLTAAHATQAAGAIASAQLVYGQFETSLSAVEAAFSIALTHGVPTVLNPSPWQAPSDAVRRSTHTLIVNETEVQQLLGLRTPLSGSVSECANAIQKALTALWTAWPKAQRLVVTLGAQGCLAWERSQPDVVWHAPARSVQAVDTVGAGDAFASGYCAAILAGHSLTDAMRWGNACGAHLASHAGVLDTLPNASQLLQLLDDINLPCSELLPVGMIHA
jgi:ribokinase